MAAYASDEFYGDFLEHRIDTVKGMVRRVLTYIVALVFIVVFVALWSRPDQTNSQLNRVFGSMSGENVSNPFQWLIGVGLFVLLFPFVFSLLYLLRKYLFFPKRTLTQQAFVPVRGKKLIVHPRPDHATSNPKSYLITVEHPVSQKSIPVATDEAWFEKLNEGDLVHVFYHPAGGNIIYLKKK